MAFVISKKRPDPWMTSRKPSVQLRHQRVIHSRISATPPPSRWSSRGRSGSGEFLPQLTQLPDDSGSHDPFVCREGGVHIAALLR